MLTLPEQIAAATAKLDVLLKTEPAAGEETVTLTASEILGRIAEELKGEVTKERAAYHKGVLETLAKNNYEATEFRPLKVLDDPMKVKPKEESIGTVQSVTTGTPDSLFATNLKTALSASQKAQLIHKALTNRDKIQKGVFSDKLEDIIDMFGFTKADLETEHELRWKISDLVYQLQSAAKLERLVEKSAEPASKTEPEASKEAPKSGDEEDIWPGDMASAKFDPVAKKYQREEPAWGRDTRR